MSLIVSPMIWIGHKIIVSVCIGSLSLTSLHQLTIFSVSIDIKTLNTIKMVMSPKARCAWRD